MVHASSSRTVVSEVNPVELEQLLARQADKIALIDVRTPDEYQLEHIPTAVLIPVDDIESNISKIQKLIANRQLITYCASGPRSYRALKILKQHQISGSNLSGGFDAWWKFKHS